MGGAVICIIHENICSGGHCRGPVSGCGQLQVVWPALTPPPPPLTSSAGAPLADSDSGTAAGTWTSASALGACNQQCSLLFLIDEFYSPALDHEVVDSSGSTRRWRKAVASPPIVDVYNLFIGGVSERREPKCPHFVQDHPKAPHVAGTGVPLVQQSLWSCPFDWYLPSSRIIIPILCQVARQPKICYLQRTILHRGIELVVQKGVFVTLIPCISCGHPGECSWQLGHGVQISSQRDTPWHWQYQ